MDTKPEVRSSRRVGDLGLWLYAGQGTLGDHAIGLSGNIVSERSHDRYLPWADLEWRVVNDLRAFELIGEILAAERGAAVRVRLCRRVDAIDADWPRLVRLASEHLVTPALAGAFRRTSLLAELDEELASYFDAILDLNRHRNRRLRDQVGALLDVLNRAGIVPIALKGAAYLLLGLFEDAGERVIGDIDLLVPHGRSADAVEVLIASGYGAVDEEPDYHHHHPALVHVAWPAAVEIHKEAVPHLYRRALPADVLARRARPLVVEGRRVGVPCGEDLIVHNIVHGQLADRDFWSADISLRDAYDLLVLTRRFRGEIDWARLSARLSAEIGRSKVGFYVGRVHRLFGEQPPEALPCPLGARFMSARWALHAAGWFPGLQHASRVLAYHGQVFARLLASAAERRRLVRRLLTLP